jgi:hypothetical protein
VPSVTHNGFRIKSISDGTLYKARVERRDGSQFHANGKTAKVWETAQFMGRDAAIGQAIYAIDTGRLK